MTAKSWCYTWNNYTDKDIEQLNSLTVSQHRCCKEVGKNGTKHLQGAITFKRAYRASQLKKLFPPVHWEMAKTCDPENYCIKGEICIDIDNRKQGSRTDWLAVAKCTTEQGLKETAKNYPYEFIKFHKGLKALKDTLGQDDLDVWYDTKVYVLWGDSGAGKSRGVREICRSQNIKLYNVPEPINGSVWFDGYDEEEAILLDDFYGWIKYHTLLQWCDGYPMKIPYKGGYTNRKWKYVFITSNTEPCDWYRRDEITALERRLTTVKHVTTCDCDRS